MTAPLPWLQTESIDAQVHAGIRRHMMFEGFKWDPQVGDVATLSPTPLVLTSDAWATISRLAEQLAAECLACEAELLTRPDLWRELALPRAIRRALRQSTTCDQRVRVMRLDFHHTTEGWRVSEVNCDVPGGYVEATTYTNAMAAHTSFAHGTGDPTAALVHAIGGTHGSRVALVHATAYADDAQVMHHLARALHRASLCATLVAPDQLQWSKHDVVLRFFPAEWLPQLSRRSQWMPFFARTSQIQCNPAAALLVQSKRWPLLWDRLSTPTDTWRQLLPETRAVPLSRRREAGWVLKPAFGRVGEGLGMIGVTTDEEWKQIRRALWLGGRRDWIMQRRFETVPWRTDRGVRYPCIGVYVINGKTCGAYGRAGTRAIVDQHAEDMAVLVQPTSEARGATPAHRVEGVALCQ